MAIETNQHKKQTNQEEERQIRLISDSYNNKLKNTHTHTRGEGGDRDKERERKGDKRAGINEHPMI